MEIIKLRRENARDVVQLIRSTFSRYVASSFTTAGKASFLEQITEEAINKKSKDCECYVALESSKVMGVIIVIPEKSKISALFVDRLFQRHGIATALLNRAETLFKKTGSKSIHVLSSQYAVKFYEKRGFKKTRGVVNSKKGWTYQPMRKILA